MSESAVWRWYVVPGGPRTTAEPWLVRDTWSMPVGLPFPQVRRSTSSSVGSAMSGRPETEGLIDRFGRVADDLRVSLTDKCNLRCTYCMPAEGLPSCSTEQLMTVDEITRLVTIAVEKLGVRSVRLTGGEPLLRAELVDIVAAIAQIRPDVDLSLTTNGIGLANRASALRDAGLHRINISLDTLDQQHAAQLTRRSFLPRVLEGIEAAVDAGFDPVKINAVVMPGINDGTDIVNLTQWCLGRGLELRFIEQMPLDADGQWDRSQMFTAAQVREELSAQFVLLPQIEARDGAPAERFTVATHDGEMLGVLGIIASVSEPFCSDCRRTRLTATGSVRSCLFSTTETQLLPALRAGESDQELAQLWRSAMWAKPATHGIDSSAFERPSRSMSQIGG